MTSAEQHLAKAKAANEQAAQARRIDNFTTGKAAGLKVPDLNPADEAVLRMKKHAAALKEFKELPPTDRNSDIRDRVARLENLLQLTLDSLNANTIEAVCNMDGTITVTLTLPDLPT
jgi:hypothetical protein